VKHIILTILMLPMMAHAWTTTQKALYLSAQSATVIDWAQTRYIAKHPDKFTEVNPILGKKPSTDNVDAFMVARLALNHGVAHYVGDNYRTPVLIGMNLAYWGAVIHNDRIGVKMDHADKVKHVAVSASIAAAVKAYGYSDAGAFAISLLPGIAKELHDHKRGSGWSNRDMIANALGAGIGIKSANWFIKQDAGQTVIGYRTEF